MSKVKSIRLNRKGENMLNTLKHVASGTTLKSDSAIFHEGLEALFSAVAKAENRSFVREMDDTIMDIIKLENMPSDASYKGCFAPSVFRRITDILEVLSYSDGRLLESEFICFMNVVQDGSVMIELDEDGEVESISNGKHQMVYDKVIQSEHDSRYSPLDILDENAEKTGEEQEHILDQEDKATYTQIDTDFEIIYDAIKKIRPTSFEG